MTYADVATLMKEAKLSPEDLGKRLGISGMTLRRWSSLPQQEDIPQLYRSAFYELVYEFLAEGLLGEESAAVKVVIKEGGSSIFQAALKNLGFTDGFLSTADNSPENMITGLSQVGSSETKQKSVDRSLPKVLDYGKISGEWKFRVQTLFDVIKSKNLKRFEKFAAYGALFYLISPFDLIPDNIPVFGLMDDFFILGLVVMYYVERYPKVAKKKTKTLG